MWNTLLEVFWCLNRLYFLFNLSVLTNVVSDVPRNSEAGTCSLYPGHSSLSACMHNCACTGASARCGPYLMHPEHYTVYDVHTDTSWLHLVVLLKGKMVAS